MGLKGKHLFIQLRVQVQLFPGGRWFFYTYLGKIPWVAGTHMQSVLGCKTRAKSGPGSNSEKFCYCPQVQTPLALAAGVNTCKALKPGCFTQHHWPPRNLLVSPHQTEEYSLLHRYPLTSPFQVCSQLHWSFSPPCRFSPTWVGLFDSIGATVVRGATSNWEHILPVTLDVPFLY